MSMNITVIENPTLRPLTEEEISKMCTGRTGDTYCTNTVVRGNKCAKHTKIVLRKYNDQATGVHNTHVVLD